MGARSPVAVLRPVYPYKFEVSASVTAPSDLKGKNVGISSVGARLTSPPVWPCPRSAPTPTRCPDGARRVTRKSHGGAF